MSFQEIFWFSNRCPYFSAIDAESYIQSHMSDKISEKILLSSKYFKAAIWLNKNLEFWNHEKEKIKSEIEKVLDVGGGFIYWGDKKYPEKLKNIFHPPSVLIYRGSQEILNSTTVGIVGSRRPTDLGRTWIKKIMPELLKEEIVVISGGARGIDYEAHMQCILNNGKTVAFLPGGVLNPYPSSHHFLFENILHKNGLLVSEFLSSDGVRKENFHQRNRLIAGCSDALVIVEAALKSGTIMTAGKAMEQNKDLLVLPGSPLLKNYEGSLELICQGANVVRSAQEILIELQDKINLKKVHSSNNLINV